MGDRSRFTLRKFTQGPWMSAKVPNRRDTAAAPTQKAWPSEVVNHPSIASDWDDPLLHLDASPARLIDLSAVPVPANSSRGGPFTVPQTLIEFPHWMNVARAYAASALSRYRGYDAVDVVINNLNHVFRFFAWCVDRRVYRLSALTLSDMSDLAEQLRPAGWASALDFDARIAEIIDKGRDDPRLIEKLISNHGSKGSVRVSALSREIGVVISARELPPKLRLEMIKLSGLSPLRSGKTSERSWSQSSFKTCYAALNQLAFLPEGIDRIAFEPFPNSREHARQSGARPDGRTINLPIEEAAKMLDLALKWVYVRSEGVVELLTVWRTSILEAKGNGQSVAQQQLLANKRVRESYPLVREKHGLPAVDITEGNDIVCTSVTELVKQLETSVMILVGINQARRKNEVLGEGGRPWGLYEGCLALADPFVDAYEIDIYIEKTWRQWLRMFANKLTVDAVKVLERVRLAIVGPAEPMARVKPTLQALRQRKLFVLPSHDLMRGDAFKPIQYSFGSHSDLFFDEAGIADEHRRTHSLRRIFALIYTYRWDHPSLQALSEHLCHLDLECTRTYVTDPSLRAEAERIERLHRVRSDCFPDGELAEAQARHADDLIRAMLTSTGSGGPLTRRVRLWVRFLLKQVEFGEADIEQAHQAVKAEFDKRGYAPTSYRHGACWATGNRMIKRAACSDGNSMHRERAGIGVCRTCPFHSTSGDYLRNLDVEINNLDERVSSTEEALEKRAAEIGAKKLRELVILERELMARYAAPFSGTGART